MIAPFLEFLLLANFLVIVSFFGFELFNRIIARAGWRASHQQLVRCGQVLWLLAFLSPVFFSAIPERNLPEMRMPSFFSGSEGRAKRNGSNILPQRRELRSNSISLEGIHKITGAVRGLRGDHWTDPSGLIVAVWILGLIAFASRLLWNLGKLNKLLAASILVRRRGRIKIAISSSITVPISVFNGSAWVVLPESMLGSRGDLKLALKHELQHHRQGDTLWAFLVEWLVCFFYLNPAAYLWKRRIVELQEFSCDEALVGQQSVSSREYGSCLIRVAETALGCREVYVGTTYMAAATRNPAYFKSFLQRRIEMLTSQNRIGQSRWCGLVMGTLGILCTVSLAYGVEKSARWVKGELPNPGQAVVNEQIQRITQRILKDAVVAEEASEGFAIVADPQSGRILAIANVDMKKERKGHWVLEQLLEPASIAKTLVAAEAIEQGKTSPEEKHFCENGAYKLGGKVFHDWKTEGFSYLTTTQTIARSSDICTVKIAEKLGLEGIHGLLEKYGFGPDGTARSFPESRVGQLPPREGPLEKFLVPFVAYGQGFRSTAIELVQAYGAFANGGNLLMPLAADAPDSDRKVVRRVLSAENAEKVKEILREVVLTGTGRRNAGSYLYTTAGKTATSFSPDDEWLEESRGTRKGNVAGFIGFAPVSFPRVEVYVGIRDPQVSVERNSGAHGSEHAAPVFKQIAEAVLQEMRVAPDNL